jgi:hypothetical protein
VLWCVPEILPRIHCMAYRSVDSQDSRKRPRLSDSFVSSETSLSTSEKTEEDLLEAWWEASRSSTLVVGGVPSLPQFDGMEDRKQKAGKGPCLKRVARAKKLGHKGSSRKRTCVLALSVFATSSKHRADPPFLAAASPASRS